MNKTIEVILINQCNFSCDYCIAGSNLKDNWVIEDGNKKWISTPSEYMSDSSGYPIIKQVDSSTPNDVYEECFASGTLTNNQAMDARKLINYINKNLNGWTIVISGGEPLMYPGIDQLLLTISETNDIILLTNTSLIQKHPHILDMDRVFLRIGYHPEYRDLIEFHENMEYIKNRTDNYVVNYVHHPRHRDRGTDTTYISFLTDNNYRYEITPYKGEYKGKPYDYDHIVVDRNLITTAFTERVPINEQLKPGDTFLTMYADGNIWDCHRKQKNIGNLNDGSLNRSNEPLDLPCLGYNCACDSMRAYRHVEQIKNQIHS